MAGVALTAILSTAADLPTDFTALITEHGQALIDALTAVSDAAAPNAGPDGHTAPQRP